MEKKPGTGTWVMQSAEAIRPIVRILGEHMIAHAPGKPPMSAAHFIVDRAKIRRGLRALAETVQPEEAEEIQAAAEEYLRMSVHQEDKRNLALERAVYLRQLILKASAKVAAKNGGPAAEWTVD